MTEMTIASTEVMRGTVSEQCMFVKSNSSRSGLLNAAGNNRVIGINIILLFFIFAFFHFIKIYCNKNMNFEISVLF